MVKEATKFSRELGIELTLTYPVPMCRMEEDEQVQDFKVKEKLRSTQLERIKHQVPGQPWHGKLIASGWKRNNEVVAQVRFVTTSAFVG